VAVVRLSSGGARSVCSPRLPYSRVALSPRRRSRVPILRSVVAGHHRVCRLVACHLGVAAFPSQSLFRVTSISPVSSLAHLLALNFLMRVSGFHIIGLLPFLEATVPACVSFGPFFLLLGILFRTELPKANRPRWLATAALIAGTVMITVAMIYFLDRLPIK
jgi:hypothetical protein